MKLYLSNSLFTFTIQLFTHFPFHPHISNPPFPPPSHIQHQPLHFNSTNLIYTPQHTPHSSTPSLSIPHSPNNSTSSSSSLISILTLQIMSLENSSDFDNTVFNAADWVNASVELMGNTDDLDSFLSSLSMKVQVLSQDCGDSIESQMKGLLARLPDMVFTFIILNAR